MKFKSEYTFRGIDLNDYEKLYFNEDFNIELCATLKLARELVDLKADDNQIVRVVKVGPDRTLPGPVAKIVGSDRIDYEEHIRYTFGSYKADWHTVSSVMTDKIDSRGTVEFKKAGSDGVTRIVSGEIKVKIFGVGKVVEKVIVAETEKSYADAGGFTQAWIDKAR